MWPACVSQAMKGEKGMPGVSVGEGLGEELTDDSFSEYPPNPSSPDRTGVLGLSVCVSVCPLGQTGVSVCLSVCPLG